MSLNPLWRQDYYDLQMRLESPTASRFMPLATLTPIAPAVLPVVEPQALATTPLCFTVDGAGMILTVNGAGAIALGYATEALVGIPLSQILHPQDRLSWQRECQVLWSTGGQARQSLLRFVCDNGCIIHQTLTAHVLQGGAEPVMLWVGAELPPQPDQTIARKTELEQIDEILRMQAELQLSYNFEATLKRITDKVRDSLEEDQILQAALQEVARAIGVQCCNASLYDVETRSSTVHYEYTHILSPYQGRVVQMDGAPEIYAQLVEGQAFQFCSLTPNLERGRVVMLACPMMDDQGVVGDLWLINQPEYQFTEQVIRLVQQVANQCAIAIRQARLFQAAQAQVKELERLNQLKDDFLSTVSHELRTPMTNIKLAIQMLEMVLKQSGLLDDKTQRASKYFNILQTECRREIGLINDLLDLSRLEAGSESLALSNVDLFAWIPSITQPFVDRAHSHQQRLLLNLEPTLPTIKTDRSHLERILSELLQNACKYTPAGEKIIVSAQVMAHQVGTHKPQKTLHLSVTNTGIEIPSEELSRIFEKFYRIPNNDPWQHGGTGLGLALATRLAEHLGGTMLVESSRGKTCFTLVFGISGEL